MTEEVQVEFDTGGANDAIEKVRRALQGLGLEMEPLPDEHHGKVFAAIFKGSWDAADKVKLRDVLRAERLPGTWRIGAVGIHGFART